MKQVLIASFDMEIGGVERSLISMLDSFDYDNNNVDLMLYSHTGEFMSLLTNKVNLLNEVKKYKTFRKSIGETIREGYISLAIARILSKVIAKINGQRNNLSEHGIYQMQLMWKYGIPFLPKLDKEYDVAISYLWPHYFVAEKVKAKRKIAWIHTDYSILETDVKIDLEMWNKFDYIIAVSLECKKSFLNKYPSLHNKVIVMENITSPTFIKKMSEEEVEDDIAKDTSFKLLSVARFSHAKGIDNAIRALKILHNRGLRDIKWYVVGYGGDEAMLRKLIVENKLEESFILLGKKINPYPYIKACDIYVQPSRYEGKAVTVVEAQILSKPVIITNYTTAKSQVRENIDGYICDLSVGGIADGVENLYRNKELREILSTGCQNTNYSNSSELKVLYELF